MKTFIESHFGYSPARYYLFVWMFCCPNKNQMFNHLHNHPLRIVFKCYKGYENGFTTILSFTIRHRNIQISRCIIKSLNTAEKMKFFMKDFFRKYDQIYIFLRIWSHLLKKSLMGNFIFCAAEIH